jgi:thermostable 8-oxoguanine DNA glycosylase
LAQQDRVLLSGSPHDHPEWWQYWKLSEDLFVAAVAPKGDATEKALDQELLFCLLGGWGITYELASATFECVTSIAPLRSTLDSESLERLLYSELDKQQFVLSHGRPRRYRFPARKAKLIVAARDWLAGEKSVFAQLTDLLDERERRVLLCACPGVGPKTASWILRNLGLGSRLAILDIHVRRALLDAGVLDGDSRCSYEEVEQRFLTWCDSIYAEPAALDLFLWEWQRGSLLPTR